MVIPLVLVVLPLGLLFLLSGLIVNAIQVQLHADQETYQLMGKEHALIISNHRSDIDWLIGWILAQRSGCLGSTLAIMKKSSKFLPVIGWSMWFSEYLFLERSWAKDEKTLKWGLRRLKDFPRSFWLALFVEVGIMRDFVPAIYDTTVIIPKDSPAPTMLRILKGQSSVVHVRIKRHAMSDMPKFDEDVSKWCKDIFVAKDALLDKHIATGTFDEEIRPIGRPVKSLLVVLSWSCLLLYGAYRFLQWTQLLSTWKGIILLAAGLALVTGVMHVFIMFSQSERSSSARAARNRVKKD
ncbi:hypothetical protein BDA96_08G125100 [Sorghum bicolor]|uniref:1-acylglycerol-3-phosphate O-acyltransferase n=1 Tax=Sorghum bicolor TaxID=4558 RepID=A0A921U7D3_SORBI|nr:hypothetical protein BDA96_08G125100 [Sorghum bicolor]